MKRTKRSMLFSCLLALCLSAFGAEAANSPESVVDMIPYESLACIIISDLDVVANSVMESPEWQEIMNMPEIAEQLDQAKQALSFGPMLFGISIEEFMSTFGHRMAVCLIGMAEQMPVAGLIVDTGDYKEAVENAAEQAATLPAIAGGAMIEEDEYRDIPCTSIGNEAIQVKYGFLDNFLVAGVGGGFEKLVDLYKDGGKSIKDTDNFQFMEQKVSMPGNLCVYADIERAAPIVKQQIFGVGPVEASDMSPKALANLAFESAKAFALNLDLLGHTNEAYLYLKQAEPHPITDLVLAPRSPMYSADLVPLDDGVMVGLHIGEPAELLDKGLKLTEFLGTNTQEMETKIQLLEDATGLNLRDDLLSALTGEVAVITILPKEPVDITLNKVQMAMQAAKVRSAVLIGIRDRSTLEETFTKLCQLVGVETLSLKEEFYKGIKIHTKVMPMNMLLPGVALMPAYAFRDNLMIISSSAEWVRDAIDLLDAPVRPETRKKLSESRILVNLDIAGIADFAMKQSFIEEFKPPEPVRDKLTSLGSVAASFALGPDGAGIRLISTSDDNWATKILRGAVIGIHADIISKQEQAMERERAMEQSEWEEEHEVKEHKETDEEHKETGEEHGETEKEGAMEDEQ